MKELEQGLGLELLDRSEAPYHLTEAGKRLEKFAREFLQGVDGLIAGARGERPWVTVEAGESIFQWLIIPLLAGPLAGPEWRLRCRNVTSREAIEGVRSRRIDVAVVPSEDAAGDLDSVRLASYSVVAIGKAGVWGNPKPSRWSDLHNRRLALLEGRRPLRGALESLHASNEDRPPEIGLECTSYPQVIEACSVGGFVGLVPELAAGAARGAGLEAVKIAELSKIRIDLVLVWNRAVAGTRREVDALVKVLRGT